MCLVQSCSIRNRVTCVICEWCSCCFTDQCWTKPGYIVNLSVFYSATLIKSSKYTVGLLDSTSIIIHQHANVCRMRCCFSKSVRLCPSHSDNVSKWMHILSDSFHDPSFFLVLPPDQNSPGELNARGWKDFVILDQNCCLSGKWYTVGSHVANPSVSIPVALSDPESWDAKGQIFLVGLHWLCSCGLT